MVICLDRDSNQICDLQFPQLGREQCPIIIIQSREELCILWKTGHTPIDLKTHHSNIKV